MVTKAQKESAVSDIKNIFDNSKAVVGFHYRGLSVVELEELRGSARKNNASIRITKNTLTKIASKDTSFEGLGDILKGPTAIAASSDEVAAAKVIHDFAKDNEKIVILGGVVDGKTLDESEVKALASMPSLDESRGKIVGLLQAPASKLASVLQAPGGQVARVIAAKAQQ